MKKYFEQESIEALRTAGFFLGALVYFNIFGFMWGVILCFYLLMFFFALPLVWKQSLQKSDKVGLIWLGLWWLLPILTLLF
jgi:hypothetical protein